MRWLPHSPVLVALSILLLIGALLVAFQTTPATSRPVPQPVADGDYEIAWLYPATSTANWERFVAGLRRMVHSQLKSGDNAILNDGAPAFPSQTTATPEVAISWPSSRRRLVIRWYKLTSDWKTRDWIEALCQRQPPPLAFIGGSNSDAAREQAYCLQQASATLEPAHRPLLLITTATADRVPEMREDAPGADPASVPQIGLTDIHEGRTFRFCFSNQQMADAVMHFVWRTDDLRPDSDPVHVVRWHDDTYSSDLMTGFLDAVQRLVVREAANSCAWAMGAPFGADGFSAGSLPVRRLGVNGSDFRMTLLPTPQLIDSSVGTFLTPNRFEGQAARNLLDLALARPQRRPLLVVTGQTLPSRRFLRALVRLAPDYARRFVVVTGDGVPFNAVFRDRQVLWPIQDLPFPLVFFSHYNPVDADAGFRPHREPTSGATSDDANSGTDDVLLNRDLSEAIALAVSGRDFCRSADEFASRLREMRLNDGHVGYFESGRHLFGPDGNRRPGTGEHIVCLRPHCIGERVLPEADIEVWARHSLRVTGPLWEKCGDTLLVNYDDALPEGVLAP